MAKRTWKELTETGKNTSMGTLLRRYWWPIAGASELKWRRKMPIRILGEDLVLYEAASGTRGLIDRRCAHRGANLVNGILDADEIRCSYHGWRFNSNGHCTDIPFSSNSSVHESNRCKIKIVSYRVRELGGLIWAYLGPDPIPLLPDWEFFHWKNGFVQIVISNVPCNWLQCQENSVDPVHFEWLHTNYSRANISESYQFAPRHRKLSFEEFEYGILYRRLRENTTVHDPLWATGRVCLWPAAVFPGNHIEYRVPVDDNNTLSIGWFFDRAPREREPYVQRTIPVWHGPVFREGSCIDTHIINQDFMAFIGQGEIVDRSKETLSHSDRGILLLRKIFSDDLRLLLSEGKDPKGIIRDPAKNNKIKLPVADRSQLVEGLALADMLNDPFLCERLRRFIFQAGQPDDVRLQFEDAMGIKGIELPRNSNIDFLYRSHHPKRDS